MEEKKSQKSSNAKQPMGMGGRAGMLPPRQQGKKQSQPSVNDDLDFVMDDHERQSTKLPPVHRNSNIGKKSNGPQKTLVNAGMSASRKNLMKKDKSQKSFSSQGR